MGTEDGSPIFYGVCLSDSATGSSFVKNKTNSS